MKSTFTKMLSFSSLRGSTHTKQAGIITLIALFLTCSIVPAFSQFQCPFSSSRNNGNGNCGSGGSIDFSLILNFEIAPNPIPDIAKIMDAGGDILYDNTDGVTNFETYATLINSTSIKYCINVLENGQHNLPSGVLIILFDNGSECNLNDLLPVELTAFEARMQNRTVQLNWATASENGNKGFVVERSKDGIRFEQIGFVEGNGFTSIAQSYHFEDLTPLRGINYYRLKQMDFNGSFEYSKAVSAYNRTKANISIYAQPARGVFTLLGSQLPDQQALLLNTMGQQMEVQVSKQQIDISEYPAGIYFLKLKNEDIALKFIKQ